MVAGKSGGKGMTTAKNFLASKRTQTILKVAGAMLALMGMLIGGSAADPVIWPG